MKSLMPYSREEILVWYRSTPYGSQDAATDDLIWKAYSVDMGTFDDRELAEFVLQYRFEKMLEGEL
jgi:hypothetical protein